MRHGLNFYISMLHIGAHEWHDISWQASDIFQAKIAYRNAKSSMTQTITYQPGGHRYYGMLHTAAISISYTLADSNEDDINGKLLGIKSAWRL